VELVKEIGNAAANVLTVLMGRHSGGANFAAAGAAAVAALGGGGGAAPAPVVAPPTVDCFKCGFRLQLTEALPCQRQNDNPGCVAVYCRGHNCAREHWAAHRATHNL
jgi:hypothetical protein